MVHISKIVSSKIWNKSLDINIILQLPILRGRTELLNEIADKFYEHKITSKWNEPWRERLVSSSWIRVFWIIHRWNYLEPKEKILEHTGVC